MEVAKRCSEPTFPPHWKSYLSFNRVRCGFCALNAHLISKKTGYAFGLSIAAVSQVVWL